MTLNNQLLEKDGFYSIQGALQYIRGLFFKKNDHSPHELKEHFAHHVYNEVYIETEEQKKLLLPKIASPLQDKNAAQKEYEADNDFRKEFYKDLCVLSCY